MKYIMKVIGSAIFCIIVFNGCSSKISICPIYPKPNQNILTKIKSLNDQEVNSWMIEQYKLNLKLKECEK